MHLFLNDIGADLGVQRTTLWQWSASSPSRAARGTAMYLFPYLPWTALPAPARSHARATRKGPFPWLKLGHGIPSKPTPPDRRTGSTFPSVRQAGSGRSSGEHRPTGRASCCSDGVVCCSSCRRIHRALRVLGTVPLPAAITSHVGNMSVWPALHQLHPGPHPPQPGRTSLSPISQDGRASQAGQRLG